MKMILQGALLLVLTIAFLVSCTKDEDKYYPNTVKVDGERIQLKGAYTGYYRKPDRSDMIARKFFPCSV